MNDYKELIKELRGGAEWAEANIYQVPIMLPDYLAQAADLIEQLVQERDVAIKCIEDIETYLQLGAPQYSYKVITEWRGV